MPFLEWNASSLSVKVKAMDDEHIQLIGLMNKLYDRNAAKAQKAEVTKVAQELVAYVKKHFADEEKYMESVKYPDTDKHRRIHQGLLMRLDEFVANYATGKAELNDEFFRFLKVWLTSHIAGVDQKYGEYVEKHAA